MRNPRGSVSERDKVPSRKWSGVSSVGKNTASLHLFEVGFLGGKITKQIFWVFFWGSAILSCFLLIEGMWRTSTVFSAWKTHAMQQSVLEQHNCCPATCCDEDPKLLWWNDCPPKRWWTRFHLVRKNGWKKCKSCSLIVLETNALLS